MSCRRQWLIVFSWFLGCCANGMSPSDSTSVNVLPDGEGCESLVQRKVTEEPYVEETEALMPSEITPDGDLPDVSHHLDVTQEDGDVPEVSLPMKVTQEAEEEAFDSLADQLFTETQQKEFHTAEIGPICGNEIVEDGEECDSDMCCTEQCKFAPKTVLCHVAADPCDGGGYCAGDRAACIEGVVRAGVTCPQGGKCFQGTCASRAAQCLEAGLGEPCGQGCDLLSCKGDSGNCITMEDTPVVPGTPCGADSQCSVGSTCVASTDLPDDDVVSDSLVQISTLNQTGMSLAQSLPQLLGVKVCWVVTRRAYNGGYNWHKILELSSWLDVVYRKRSSIPVQILPGQLYIDHAGELDSLAYANAGIGTFSTWVQKKKREGAIKSDMAHVQFLGGTTCGGPSGVAYIGALCHPSLSVGMTFVTNTNTVCEHPNPYTFRWGTIAHELGHNLGMKHLWANTGGAQGATNHIMDYGNYNLWSFHQESRDDYNNHKNGFTCMKPLHASNARGIYVKNVHTGRFLFADGHNVRSSRGLEAGWLVAPKVIAADANYYNLARWILIPMGSNNYVIEHWESGRVLLSQGNSVIGKPYASEAGWVHAPITMAADSRYYSLYLWRLVYSRGHTFIKSVATGRFLQAQGSIVHGKYAHERSWTRAPTVVLSDANYYNLAAWDILYF